MRGFKRVAVDNNGPTPSTGTIQIADSFFFGGETLTLDDGTNVHVITFNNLGGGFTDKDTVDYGGGLTVNQIASELADAINLAEVAGDTDLTATAEADTVTVTHTANGNNNEDITTDAGDSLIVVSGLSGGSDDVGAPRFTAQSVVVLAGRSDGYFREVALTNRSLGELKVSFASDADPADAAGDYVPVAAGATRTFTFADWERETAFYLNGGNLPTVEIAYTIQLTGQS